MDPDEKIRQMLTISSSIKKICPDQENKKKMLNLLNGFEQIEEFTKMIDNVMHEQEQLMRKMNKYLHEKYDNNSGLAVIMSWSKYSPTMRDPKLETVHDRENLKAMFQTLGYKVIVHNNLTKEATKAFLKNCKFFQ